MHLFSQDKFEELIGVVATREVELQAGGVVKHSFNLDNVKLWVIGGNDRPQNRPQNTPLSPSW